MPLHALLFHFIAAFTEPLLASASQNLTPTIEDSLNLECMDTLGTIPQT